MSDRTRIEYRGGSDYAVLLVNGEVFAQGHEILPEVFLELLREAGCEMVDADGNFCCECSTWCDLAPDDDYWICEDCEAFDDK